MQLVAYGAQDIYLTGNPQITFFKVVYRRHTNFSMEAIQQTFNGSVGAGPSTVTSTISRNGDLISNLWLDVKLSAGLKGTAGDLSTTWTNNTGHALIKECEVEIGGQRIDRHYSQWLDIWNELTDHDEKEWVGLNKHNASRAYYLSGSSDAGAMLAQRLYVPLKFWFCRNPGLALPLIALQYHEVKVKITTRGMAGLVNIVGWAGTGGLGPKMGGTAAPPTEFNLWADYIYLDTDERRRFAQVSHEYLIEQVQRETGAMSTNQKLNFNHPVKELVWVVQDNTVATENTSATAEDVNPLANVGVTQADKNDYFNYQGNTIDDIEILNGVTSYETFATAKLQLNGHDRFAARNASYFRICQPIQSGHKIPRNKIYNYSFALKPEEHQPSGTCNFSRIDNAKIIFTTAATPSGSTLTVYAVNYNVLRIMSGMGGLAYSN